MKRFRPRASSFTKALIVSAGVIVAGLGIARERGIVIGDIGETILAPFSRLNGVFTDAKFLVRGPQSSKNKIVLLEIDSASLEEPELGRWPWSRRLLADLIESVAELQPKMIGLDIVFSEAQKTMPSELLEELREFNLANLTNKHDADFYFAKMLFKNQDKVVLGWSAEDTCYPLYEGNCRAALTSEKVIKSRPEAFSKFALQNSGESNRSDELGRHLRAAVYAVTNIPKFNEFSKHQGFLETVPDIDGIIRRVPLLTSFGPEVYPSFALQMAIAAHSSTPNYKFDRAGRLTNLDLGASLPPIHKSVSSAMNINYRGPYPSFAAVSVRDFASGVNSIDVNGRSVQIDELFKDAYVIIGVSAWALGDRRNTPFDVFIPGMEIHATVLDNLLSGDALRTEASSREVALAALAIIIVFGFVVSIMERQFHGWRLFLGLSLPLLVLIVVDYQLFSRLNVNIQSAPHYLTMLSLIGFSAFNRFRDEEKKRDFIRSAFSRYIDPTVVDQLIKDPAKLSLGMYPQPVTVLFCDLRGFTALSEKLDSKRLSEFLNEYYELMTSEIQKQKGTVDKFIGDALMAFWGAPIADETHSAKALQAALRMRMSFEKARSDLEQRFGSKFDIGIGLNTGTAQVGNVGSKSTFNFTVLGETVNLASRLEGLSKQYGCPILTTLDTLESSGLSESQELFWRVVDRVKVKGSSRSVDVVEITHHPFPEGFLGFFKEGRELYRSQEWIQASNAFNFAQAIYLKATGHRDQMTELLLDRISFYRLHPPLEDWDGSWVMKDK